MNSKEIEKAVETLSGGGIAVLPTDTIYAIHCMAIDKRAVERVYDIRKRDVKKPFIILVDEVKQIELFGISITEKIKIFLQKIWPGKVSIVVPIKKNRQTEFDFLHRGTGALGFRMPAKPLIREILKQTGPLISTSVNFQGEAPAKSILEAKEIFGKNIDFYLDVGKIDSLPSSVAEIKNGKLKILRKGEVDLEKVDF